MNVSKSGKAFLSIEKIIGDNYGTFGYVLSPKGASELLQNVFPLREQIDSYIISQVHSGGLAAYTVSPPLLSELKLLHKSTVQKFGSN